MDRPEGEIDVQAAQTTTTTSQRPPAPGRVWLTRQPILDRGGATHGYELTFRELPKSRQPSDDEPRASAQVIFAAFAELGLAEVVGPGKAFFDVRPEVLMSPGIESLPKAKVVLALLDPTPPDAEVVERLKELRRGGFHLAIDERALEADPRLVDLVDVVRVSLVAYDAGPALDARVDTLRRTGAKLLAARVQTRDAHARASALGFDFFQGAFFQVPQVMSARKLPQARVETMNLLATLQREDATMQEIGRLVRADASLSYRLLRLLSSAAYARSYRVDSVDRAIMLLGRARLARFVTLLALADFDDQPPAVLATAMLRAHMCERLAEKLGRPDTDACYSAGLFSLLDVMLRLPMSQVVASMPLSGELQAALTRRQGRLGTVLNAVIDYERGDWRGLDLNGLAPEDMADAYFAAARWSQATMEELGLR